MLQPKWYFSRDHHYLRIVRNEGDEQVFCSRDQCLINFWVNEICTAMRFYQWLQHLQGVRYSLTSKQEQNEADSLLNSILQLSIPEINLDSYKGQ